jgi:hypothetical protein
MKMYPELRKPTLAYTNFLIDGVANLHTALIRGGLSHRMTPQITTIDVINEDGYPVPTNNVPIYSPDYIASVWDSSEMVFRFVPNVQFDKFALPAVRHNPVLSGLVVDATTYANLPDIEFEGTPILAIPAIPTLSVVSSYGKALMKSMLACITIAAPETEPHSAATLDAMKKLSIAAKLTGNDQPNQLEPGVETISLIGSNTTLSPNDSASMVHKAPKH